MNYYKLSRLKFLYIVTIFVLLLLIYKGAIGVALFFDTDAPDLVRRGGEFVKRAILLGYFRFEAKQFEFFFYLSFVMSILTVIMGYDYLTIKNDYLKLSIGKTTQYAKKNTPIKISTCLYPSCYFFDSDGYYDSTCFNISKY